MNANMGMLKWFKYAYILPFNQSFSIICDALLAFKRKNVASVSPSLWPERLRLHSYLLEVSLPKNKSVPTYWAIVQHILF